MTDIDVSRIEPGDTVGIKGVVQRHEGPDLVVHGNGYIWQVERQDITSHTPKPKPSLVERMLDAYYASVGGCGDRPDLIPKMAAALAVVREEVAGLNHQQSGVYFAVAQAERLRILDALTPAAAPEPQPLPTTPGSVVDAMLTQRGKPRRFILREDGLWAWSDEGLWRSTDFHDWTLVLDAADHPVGGAR